MPRKLTLVVSQYEKSTTIHYTLRVYSTLPFTLRKIGNPYTHKQEITGQWTKATAGGCSNNRETHGNNPRYQFKVTGHSTQVMIELKGPKQYQIGFDLRTVVADDRESPLYFKNKQSGPYRPGFVVLALQLCAGTYDIIPSTFRPNQEGPFFLSVHASSPIKVGKLQ